MRSVFRKLFFLFKHRCIHFIIFFFLLLHNFKNLFFFFFNIVRCVSIFLVQIISCSLIKNRLRCLFSYSWFVMLSNRKRFLRGFLRVFHEFLKLRRSFLIRVRMWHIRSSYFDNRTSATFIFFSFITRDKRVLHHKLIIFRFITKFKNVIRSLTFPLPSIIRKIAKSSMRKSLLQSYLFLFKWQKKFLDFFLSILLEYLGVYV